MSTADMKRKLDELWETYEKDGPGEKSEVLALELSRGFRDLGEAYQENMNLFGMLDCVNCCRDIMNDLPENETLAFHFLETMTGLLYLKIMMSEDGMVEEFGDQIAEVASRFPRSEGINMQACGCLANLIPLCGGFDAPLSLAYGAVDKIGVLAEQFPENSAIQTVFGHALISANAIARQTDNTFALAEYREKLEAYLVDKAGIYSNEEIRGHLRQIGY